jgi:Ca2+-binding EF-hand superfamily protein
MTRWPGILVVALSAIVFLSAVEAQDAPKKLDVDAIFKKLDLNDDGLLSKAEFLKLADNFKNKEKALKKLEEAFVMLDTDMKGLTRMQFKVYLENVKKKKDESK